MRRCGPRGKHRNCVAIVIQRRNASGVRLAHAHRRSGGVEVLLGLVYALISIYLLAQPVAGLVALTLALAIYLFLEAVLEFTAWGFLRRLPGAGWLLFDGVVTLILAS